MGFPKVFFLLLGFLFALLLILSPKVSERVLAHEAAQTREFPTFLIKPFFFILPSSLNFWHNACARMALMWKCSPTFSNVSLSAKIKSLGSCSDLYKLELLITKALWPIQLIPFFSPALFLLFLLFTVTEGSVEDE